MKKSNPCSQKNDESIPVIDISKISGDVSHPPVELLEEEDEGEYKGIHNFFEEDQEVEGEQEEEKQWETEQEETTTQGQEEFKLSSVKEVREPSQHDEGIKMPEPVIMSATPTPLSTVNPTPIKMSETPKVLSQNLSDESKNFLMQFEDAILQGDGQLLSDLVYDADMEGDIQLDLQWYENKAAQLLQH